MATLPSASPAAVSAPAAAATLAAGRLPEDRVAGARAEADWRKHLADEERERRVLFDRHRLKEHRQVLASLRAARAQYDQATTRAALLKLQSDWPQTSAAIRQRIEKLDHWGNNSNLLGDYAALLQAFASAYPEARLAALSGVKDELELVQRDVDAHTKKIVDWLAYVQEAETEFGD